MVKGVFLILSACFTWGLIYVIPTFLGSFNLPDTPIGPYFLGASLGVILIGGLTFPLLKDVYQKRIASYPPSVWKQAILFALIANICYYTWLVLGIKYADPAITALIAGMAPVSISFYGNYKLNECCYSKLILPALLMGFGLFVINFKNLFGSGALGFSLEYVFGLTCACLALISWTWYVVANCQFLKKHSTISNLEWSTLIGAMTIVWIIVGAIILGILVSDPRLFGNSFVLTNEAQFFLIGTAVLGLLSTWIGSYLWNCGSSLLPVPVAGQLTIFETVFGLIFVYVVENKFPTSLECLGMCLMIIAIVYSMNMFARAEQMPIQG